MLKHICLSFIAAILVTGASFAQDDGEITKVREGRSCANCNLFQADLAYQGIRNIDVSGSRLRQSDLSLSTMDNVNFTGANLSVANLFGGRFSGANFKNVDLTNATLVGAWFGGANFAGAKLSGANLSGAYLKTAKGLTNTQLAQACGDQSTVLPTGMNLPQCR